MDRDTPLEDTTTKQDLAPMSTNDSVQSTTDEAPRTNSSAIRRGLFIALTVATICAALGFVGIVGLNLWGGGERTLVADRAETTRLRPPPAVRPHAPVAVALPVSYTFPIQLGAIGPKLLEAGVIDEIAFTQVFTKDGTPLNTTQLALLERGSDAPVTITAQNAHFLLNLLWAFGLANNNPVLTEGAMQREGKGNPMNFASTGGWTIGKRRTVEFYAKLDLVPLDAQQQARLEEAAGLVFRPCCGNATSFPDCNHGMAMLGLMELMAAQNAGVDEMLEAAKYANFFWFPQQMAAVATYLKVTDDVDFAQADARLATGRKLFSGAGFQAVNQWLGDNGYRDSVPATGPQCGA